MADICVWNRCNNSCVMCTNPIGFQSKKVSKDYSFKELIQRFNTFLPLWREDGKNINLTGGEPTIHPSFFKLCFWFMRYLPNNKIVLATNGRMFSYLSFVKRFLKLDNLYIEIAILGHNEKIHDGITRTKGSFDQTTKGIRNILKYRKKSQELEIRVILIKQNYKLVGNILDFIFKSFPLVDRIVIIFPEPEGVCGKNYKIIGVTYGEVKKEISYALKDWNDKLREIRLYHFPLCTIESKLWKHTWITQRRDEVDYLSSCNNCLYKQYCCGIHKDYLEIIGEKEFKPVRKDLNFQIGNNPHHPIVEVF